ncbi:MULTISPECIES: HAMP domain-containing sensor histidine kinase [Nostocales]|uniref:Circadian input-output histidine kinase CikA n=3 Tax=Nostocales TaxID=1161 RepID=A0A0C1N9G0_9CYAN|nr:ATP-binding protein [Tolypothrix bouteillei]KAF3887361.1 HAMP domain-containing protein [Tolypothrix bouteillei VB521301]
MAKPRQSSFRRILVSKILLLSVPVLLIGEIVAYKKARSSLLETARQNLTESAIIKGEKLIEASAALKINLINASQTTTVRAGLPIEVQKFLTKIAKQLPKQIDCIQLIDPQSNDILASTCGLKSFGEVKFPFASEGFNVETILPPKVGTTGQKDIRNNLQLMLSAPVYDSEENMRYVLRFKSVIMQQKINNKLGLLTGSTVIISDDGTILAHPIASRVGTNIEQHADAARLKSIVKNALVGKQDFLHLFFENEGEELLAGYTAIPSPVVTEGQNKKWVIISVTSLDDALYGLQDIKIILVVLTFGLVGASVLASLYVARYLAQPVEKLRDYALNLHLNESTQPVPDNFQIREFNQLAQALHQMLSRLKIWAKELELAWKEAKDANQVKTQFLAATSHELRNPLNIIINCVRIVREGMCDDREEELEFLKRADDTAIHLLGIINDILDISKIEAGKLSVVLKPVDLTQILKDVINIQSVSVQKKGLQLNIPQLEEILPVNADSPKLKQVLINVIGNATKFTEEGSITISTDIQNRDDKAEVIIKVKDTGIGIDPTQQSKLFRPFVMVDDANARKFGGTGLGLAISRNLMELMGGTITLESQGNNSGTTVTITLPLIDVSLLSGSEDQEGSNNKNISSQNKQVTTTQVGDTTPKGSFLPSNLNKEIKNSKLRMQNIKS